MYMNTWWKSHKKIWCKEKLLTADAIESPTNYLTSLFLDIMISLYVVGVDFVIFSGFPLYIYI